MKIYFYFIILLLAITSCSNAGAVEAVYVERKQVLTGEYEHVAASDIPPKPISRKAPKYPEKFINSGVQGKVKVFFVVDAQGIPVQVQYLEATDLAFAQEAIDAVKEWRFEPALKNGLAVPACMIAPFTFSAKDAVQTKQTLIERLLHAVDYVAIVRQGMLEEINRVGQKTPLTDFVANAPTAILERSVARVLSRHLSQAHVVAAVEFYESSTGRYITAIQKSQPQMKRTPLALSIDQASVYTAFVKTGAEDAIEKVLYDQKVWDEIVAELETARVNQNKLNSVPVSVKFQQKSVM